MKREDIVKCDFCDRSLNNKHNAIDNKRGMILPCRDTKYMHVMSVCICEKCYYRLPYDLQREVKRVSDNQSDKELAGYLLSAVKALNGRVDLNKKKWIWVRNARTGQGRFQRDPLTLIADDVCTVYINGKIS